MPGRPVHPRRGRGGGHRPPLLVPRGRLLHLRGQGHLGHGRQLRAEVSPSSLEGARFKAHEWSGLVSLVCLFWNLDWPHPKKNKTKTMRQSSYALPEHASVCFSLSLFFGLAASSTMTSSPRASPSPAWPTPRRTARSPPTPRTTSSKRACSFSFFLIEKSKPALLSPLYQSPYDLNFSQT